VPKHKNFGLGVFSSKKHCQVWDLERKCIFKNHKLFILWVLGAKKCKGIRLAYAYEGIFFAMPKIKIVLSAGWVHFRGCVKIFELLSFFGLNERFCETASYAYD